MKTAIPLSLFLGLLLCGCETLPEQQPQPMVVAPPPVANQEIVLDLTRHYDVTCHEGQTMKVYGDCRILGYAGPAVTTADGVMYPGFGYFDHWLVIELPDAHRVYLPPGVIAALEETKK